MPAHGSSSLSGSESSLPLSDDSYNVQSSNKIRATPPVLALGKKKRGKDRALPGSRSSGSLGRPQNPPPNLPATKLFLSFPATLFPSCFSFLPLAPLRSHHYALPRFKTKKNSPMSWTPRRRQRSPLRQARGAPQPMRNPR
jgi:hypothetical protein